jgi:lipopolysaccharide assembly protein A
MGWLCLTVVVLFVGVTILFALQNVGPVTMSCLGFNIRAPLALLSAVAYLLGAVTGGSVFALLRKSVKGPERHGHDRQTDGSHWRVGSELALVFDINTRRRMTCRLISGRKWH